MPTRKIGCQNPIFEKLITKLGFVEQNVILEVDKNA